MAAVVVVVVMAVVDTECGDLWEGLFRACLGGRTNGPSVGILKAEPTPPKQETSLLFLLFCGWAPPFSMWC